MKRTLLASVFLLPFAFAAWNSSPVEGSVGSAAQDPAGTQEIQKYPPWGLSAICHQRELDEHWYFYYDSSAGFDIDVYVLDDGVNETHPDFDGIKVEHYDARSVDWGTWSNKMHGTAVAGLVAGVSTGVAKKANIIDIQIMTNSTITWAQDAAYALEVVYDRARWLQREDRSVVVASWGHNETTDCDEWLIEQLQGLRDIDIPVVFAARNDGSPIENYYFDNTVSDYAMVVGAMNLDYNRSDISNYGPKIDLFAPGQDILMPVPDIGDEGDLYRVDHGCSFAAPLVAGTLAMLRGYDEAFRNLTVFELTEWLKNIASVNPLGGVKDSPNRLLYTYLWAQ